MSPPFHIAAKRLRNLSFLVILALAAVLLPGSAGASTPAAPPEAAITTTTFTQSTPTAIPTGPAVVTSSIIVSGIGTYLWDVDVITNITHTFSADLDITITSPAGTVVTLSTDNGAGNDNTYLGTRWDDDANPGGQVPYTTNSGMVTDNAYVNLTTANPLTPEEALAAFIGEDPNGTWVLTISDDLAGDGGDVTWSLDLTTLGGAPVTASADLTQSTAVAIADLGVTTSQIAASALDTTVCDVNVSTNISHTFPSDLDVTITSPAGTVVTLTTDNGAGNDDVFAGTVWNDDANPAGQVPYTTNSGLVTDHAYANLTLASTLVPEEPLGAFIGENPNGTWTLTISDDLGGEIGTLNGWALGITTCVAVNDAPTFVAANPPAVAEDSGPQTVAGWVSSFSPGPANESGQSLVGYTVNNVSNAALFATSPAVGNDGTLTYTPAPNAYGTSTFEVTAQDNGGTAHGGVDTSASQTFTITVYSVADADLVPLQPARLVDTRGSGLTVDGLFQGGGRLEAGTVLEIDVAGRGGVAADALGAVLNVTATETAAPGYMTVYPCGEERPIASNLNYTAGATVPNMALAKLSDGGTVCIFTSAAAQLVVDVDGFVPVTSAYQAAVPARLLETRSAPTVDGLQQGTGIVPAGAVIEVQVAGRAGVPADAEAVALTVTATQTGGPGFVTVFACGADRPNASTLNYSAGATVANAVVAQLGTGGKVCLYTSAAAHLLVDLAGVFPAGAAFVPHSPARLLETRVGPGLTTIDAQHEGQGPVPAASTFELQIAGRAGIPEDATSVMLNVTVTGPQAPGYITIYPCGGAFPLASNVNFAPGQTIANSVYTQIGVDGRVCFFTAGSTHLIVDIVGYL